MQKNINTFTYYNSKHQDATICMLLVNILSEAVTSGADPGFLNRWGGQITDFTSAWKLTQTVHTNIPDNKMLNCMG
jgi:hypothetical protein